MKLTREAIEWAYRLFLDREAEDPQVVIDQLASCGTTAALRAALLASAEYRMRNVPVGATTLPGASAEDAKELATLFAHIRVSWEQLGKAEPYWSVVTADEFRSDRDFELAHFYATGVHEAERLAEILARHGVVHGADHTCLEFGCGVGRVTGWLARRYGEVIGYDISESHLELARRYCADAGIANVRFEHIADPVDYVALPAADLVFSMIVLQHNPPPIIRFMVRRFLRALRSEGIAFFQLPTFREGYAFDLETYLIEQVCRCEMEMHVVSQREVFAIIREEGCAVLEVIEDGRTGRSEMERSNTFVVVKGSR